MEEHFYLVFPVIFVGLAAWGSAWSARAGAQGRTAVLLLLCVAVLAVRFAAFAGPRRANIYY